MEDISPDSSSEEELDISIGNIYLITAPELIETDIPHLFIIVTADEEEVFFVECTTQKYRLEKHFGNYNLNLDGLVYVKPDSENCLSKETYVNCNDYYSLTHKQLSLKISDKKIKYIGKISHNHYDQIRTGIRNSKINDLPDFMLNHPKDNE